MNGAKTTLSAGLMAAAGGIGAVGVAAALAGPQTFQVVVGTPQQEQTRGVIQTFDGGSLAVGNIRFNNQAVDMLVTKYDHFGTVQWQRVIGGAGDDEAIGVVQTSDGGYAISGETSSVGPALGMAIVKIDPLGNLMWARVYQGTPFINSTLSNAIIQCANGDLAVVGRIQSSAAALNSDGTLIRLRANGAPVFANSYHDSRYTAAAMTGFTDLRETVNAAGSPGVFKISGYTAPASTANREVLVFQADAAGNPQILRVAQFNTDAWANGIDTLGAADIGISVRFASTVFGTPGSGFIRFDPGLNPVSLWQYNIFQVAHASVRQRQTGEVILAGTYPAASAVSGDEADLLNLDPIGTPLWGWLYGGLSPGLPGADAFHGVWPTTDGGLLAAGDTQTWAFGGNDIYMVKTDAAGNSGCDQRPMPIQAARIPSPFTFSQAVVGHLDWTVWQPSDLPIQMPERVLCRNCPADFNGDGSVDFFDYDDFVTCFEGGVCPPGQTADFNADGSVDFFDYDDFVMAFEAGCP